MSEERNIVIFDLDGTLADCQHRQHFIRQAADSLASDFKPDWRGFFKACTDDTPIPHTCAILNHLRESYEIWIVSGRSAEVQKETFMWLHQHGIGYDRIFMRKENDHRPDDMLKGDLLDSGIIPKDRVICVFDDRDKVVKMWRDKGLPCYQVAEGAF